MQEKLNDRGFSVEVLGDYIGQKIKILCRCTKHNETFLGAPYKLIQGVFGCKKCKKETIQKNQRITNEEFLERLKSIQPTLKVLEEYVDSTTPLKMYCETHDCYFNESPNTYLYKKKIGCCPEHKHLKSEELFQKELYEKFKGNIVSMEKYQGQDIKINFKCKKHNKIWKTTPIIVLLGKGCPDCVGYSSEIKIFNILKEIGYDFVFQKKFENCRNKRSLIFDFYIPKLNLCVEYDGEGHYLERFYNNRVDNPMEELIKTKQRDEIKTNYCNENNINLLRIPYWEKKNIKNILINKINELENKKYNMSIPR